MDSSSLVAPNNCCQNYSKTWKDGVKFCSICNEPEVIHDEKVVQRFYSSMKPNPAALRILQQQQRLQQELLQQTTDEVILEQQVMRVDLRNQMLSTLKVGMVVDARDGNSLFTAKIISIDIEDETCCIRWLCDDTVTDRQPLCSIYVKDDIEQIDER